LRSILPITNKDNYHIKEGISIVEDIALLGVPLPAGLVGALKKLKEANDTD